MYPLHIYTCKPIITTMGGVVFCCCCCFCFCFFVVVFLGGARYCGWGPILDLLQIHACKPIIITVGGVGFFYPLYIYARQPIFTTVGGVAHYTSVSANPGWGRTSYWLHIHACKPTIITVGRIGIPARYISMTENRSSLL